jgi:lipopolysaccharide/colanic/teichoic acid biosynthesis glycosyltransferase
MDIILSTAALLAFLPFGIVIAIVLRLTGEGEVFYCQTRLGREKKPFQCLKFATMLKNSPALGSGMVTVRDDPRVLPAGKFLRKTKLNEVPQLINILKGDMAIVGPRPVAHTDYPDLSPEDQKVLFSVTPGLTSIGSIVFRDEERLTSRSPKGPIRCYHEDIDPLKAKLELWYIKNMSLWLDCRIIVLTAWVILFPTSTAYRRLLGPGWDADFQPLFGESR